ncbi:MAG: sigma-70 family RNA polymerase sigma factor [Cyclobacteriaceae bacterium]
MSAHNHSIDQDQLVKEIQERRPEALNYLYDNYSGAIYGSILRIVQEEDIAKEVLQDAFMKFWDKIDQYDSSKGRFFTWMVNVTRNLAIDKLRSKELKKAQKTDDIGDYVNTRSEGATHQNIDGIGMQEAMQGLRDEERFVLEMVYFKGYTQSEIEKEFGIPLGTIKTRLRMALVTMRKILDVE